MTKRFGIYFFYGRLGAGEGEIANSGGMLPYKKTAFVNPSIFYAEYNKTLYEKEKT